MADDPEKERFLMEFGQDYGYPNAPKNVDEIRATEFKRLNDIVYLDHAGATLYSESQMEDVFKDLNSTLYGNPRLRFDLGLVNAIKEDSYEMPRPTPSHSGRWMVLIDAAKGSATSPPDLSKYKADFVVVSFYKLFGYPTGIGALIARNELHKGSNEWHIEVDPIRFRPNLVVSGGKPYIEDGWRSLKIGQTNFTSVGGCNRCQMINMTFTAGTVQRSNEPLATLASYRRLKGKIYFGLLLKMCDSIKQEALLRAGQEIVANAE
ncbi:UNVERIFIED_CONTAM: Molybdenum cofactor sulfurase [Sesamum angustifolium]|uniref:Molybdenum cofactor sulfurase n=1 Tax=Sesamum angustifolium TaxID=2727405 RepID=A0AAW2PCV6_9LAMI